MQNFLLKKLQNCRILAPLDMQPFQTCRKLCPPPQIFGYGAADGRKCALPPFFSWPKYNPPFFLNLSILPPLFPLTKGTCKNYVIAMGGGSPKDYKICCRCRNLANFWLQNVEKSNMVQVLFGIEYPTGRRHLHLMQQTNKHLCVD